MVSMERRELSAFDIGCVVIGGIIGVGIFFTPAKVAERAGSYEMVLATWAVGGLLALFGALVFAELSTRVPGHGGMFRYIYAAFGRLPAFLFGWSNWLVIQAGALSIVALLFVVHLELMMFGTQTGSPVTQLVVAALAILLFTGTNLIGLRVGKRVQNLLTVVKVLALCVLVLAVFVSADGTAVPVADESEVPAASSPLARLASALLPVLFAIGGWQQGSFIAGAARNPMRSVPLGILFGVLVVITVYMAINLAYLDLLGFSRARVSDSIAADSAAVLWGPVGERVFAAMVAVSAAGIMNTICMAPPYVLLAMAEEGLFPAAFAHRHARWQTPVLGILGQGLWAVLLMCAAYGYAVSTAGDAAPRTIDTLGFLCDGVVFVDWLFLSLCGGALLVLRRRSAEAPWRVPGGGFVALIFTVGGFAVTLGAVATNLAPSATGGSLVALGLIGYWFLGRRK